MSSTSSARRSERIAGCTAVASEPVTTPRTTRTRERTALSELPAQRLGTVAERTRRRSWEPDDAEEEEERI